MSRDVVKDQFGRNVGYIEAGVYYTTRDREKHFFRMLQSYGISSYVLATLTFQGVHEVRITERDGLRTRVLVSRLEDWQSKARRYVDQGMDEQKHLSYQDMEVVS